MKSNMKHILKIVSLFSVLCVVAVLICMNVFAEESGDDTVLCEHTAEIIASNISLDKDITLKYYVKLCDCYKGAKMVFSFGGKSITKAAYYDAEADEYIFALTKIAPQAMGDLIDAELVFEDEVIAVKEDYSVLENCKNLLEKHPDNEKLQYLIKSLLNYGAAVQNYRDYNIDAMVNAGFEIDSLRPGQSDSVKDIINDGGEADVMAANITFDNETKVFIKVKCDYEPTVTINGVPVKAVYQEIENDVEAEETDETEEPSETEEEPSETEEELSSGIWLLYTEGITPDKFDETITFVITSNDPVTELTYSVNSYVYSMLDSQKASMRNLAMALYTYGIAVESYLAA